MTDAHAAPQLIAPHLVALNAAVVGLAFPIGDAEITIGRGTDCTIMVTHPLVSRTHARVAHVGGRRRTRRRPVPLPLLPRN